MRAMRASRLRRRSSASARCFRATSTTEAAAVMASALIELSGYSDSRLAKQYLAVAETILRTLSSSSYRAKKGENGGFILKHSVAHFPKQTEVDSPLPYADYYYVEAMMRYKKKLNAKKTGN